MRKQNTQKTKPTKYKYFRKKQTYESFTVSPLGDFSVQVNCDMFQKTMTSLFLLLSSLCLLSEVEVCD